MAVGAAVAPARLAGGATSTSAGPPTDPEIVAFHGRRQAGVATPAQAHAVVVGLDVVGGRGELAELLDRWSVAAGRLAAGEQVGERSPSSRLPPVDSGEADDRPPARLTITLAVGPALFGVGAPDRFGLASRRPARLEPLPPFEGDVLEPVTMATDLALQVCADDQQVALHAVRNLVRVSRGAVAVRWSHLGFGPPAGARGAGPSSHRNLLGFREGTANPRPGSDAFDDAVWVAAGDGPDWMIDGTYLVVRRIELDLEAWETLNLLDRERVIGRHRRSGAPIGERDEAAPLDLDAEGPDGRPVTDPRSHVALAHRASARPLFRRAYNLAGSVPQFAGAGTDGDRAGLLFLALCRDPGAQFVPVQRALAGQDLLATYVRTTGSALFAVLPGLAAGGSWASVLLDT
jgi:deferrochelatase/peroxidase EfeB